MGAATIAQGRNALSMLAFFRNAVGSIWGKVILGVVLVAFIVTLYEGGGGFGSAGFSGGSNLASVGSSPITEVDVRRRVGNQLEAARQQRPDLDMAQFIAGGGLDKTLDQMIDARTLTEFGRMQGLLASDRLVGSLLNQIPAFKGPTGQFDQKTYESVLLRLKISDAAFRDDFRAEAVINMLQIPVRGAVRLPAGVAQPYAELLLESRRGQIGTIPAEVFTALPAPTEADLATFYGRNTARYTVPERRIVRYATFNSDRFKGKVTPTDADVQRFFQNNAASFAAVDKRSFTQIIVQQQADAEKALAALRGGRPIADVAKSLGLSPLQVAPTDRDGFAKQTAPQVAAAAFAASNGGFAALQRSGLGFHVIRVDSVDVRPAKTIDQARPQIIAQLTEQKIAEATASFVAQLDSEASDGATFDELAKKYALTTVVTPAVTPTGNDPDQPGYKAAPEMAVIMRDAFKAEADDDPIVVQLGSPREHALWKLDRIVPAAARPLSAIRDQVMADARADAAAKAAGKIANAIVAKIDKGMPIAQAMAEAGVKLPPLSPAGARRIDIVQSQDRVPPPLALMFSMVAKRAKALAMPDNRGYFVVYLDSVERGNPASVPGLLDRSREELSKLAGDEYLQQFVAAARAEVGSTRNAIAVAALKKALASGGATQ